MTDADRLLFGKAIARLAATFRTEVSDETIAAYWDALAHRLSIDQFIRAGQSLSVGERFPIPKDFMDAIFGNLEQRAAQAWQLAWDKVRRVGSYQSPHFEDEAIIATIREMGGWPAFCLTEQPEHFHRKRFTDTYKIHAAFAKNERQPQLRGIHEQQNQAAGIAAPEWSYSELPAASPVRELPKGEPN